MPVTAAVVDLTLVLYWQGVRPQDLHSDSW
jgi:hypothetical protein